MELLTVAEIARRLNIPESTVRYYRDRFSMYIPSFGEGKSRRYRPETLDIIRIISESLRSGMSADIVEEQLKSMFAVNVEPQQQSAAAQQYPEIVERTAIESQESAAIVFQLVEEVQTLNGIVKEQNDKIIELMNDQNELMKAMLEMQRMPFWKRWLKR